MNAVVYLMRKDGKAAHTLKNFPAPFFRVNTLFLLVNNNRNRILTVNEVRRFILLCVKKKKFSWEMHICRILIVQYMHFRESEVLIPTPYVVRSTPSMAVLAV